MDWISIEDKLPDNLQYVLIHLTYTHWGDSDDEKGNRYLRVAKFIRGISLEDRKALSKDSPRKKIYKSSDVWGNNLKPFCWDEFGPNTRFGQDVDYWMPLPEPPKDES